MINMAIKLVNTFTIVESGDGVNGRNLLPKASSVSGCEQMRVRKTRKEVAMAMKVVKVILSLQWQL